MHDDNTILPICAAKKNLYITIHTETIDWAYRKPYQLGRLTITLVYFTVMTWSKAVFLGWHYTILTSSTTQVGSSVLSVYWHCQLILQCNASAAMYNASSRRLLRSTLQAQEGWWDIVCQRNAADALYFVSALWLLRCTLQAQCSWYDALFKHNAADVL